MVADAPTKENKTLSAKAMLSAHRHVLVDIASHVDC